MNESGPTSNSSKPPNVGTAWSDEEERRLHDGFESPADIPDLARYHQRSAGAIRSRLVRLGLLDQSGSAVSPKPPFVPSGRRAARDRSADPQAPGRPLGNVEAQALGLIRRLSGHRLRSALDVLHGLVMVEAAEALRDDKQPRSPEGQGHDGRASGDQA
jgi:hypothetical protein